ncbi:MAG: two-component system, sensor histidine kinase PdtaS [Clostridiales bacterium]|jgi:two-component sensor histidine kinase/PAS domain-containing protein|nr:two-component system, sensor histidine kinase PdtaS [Clostridiales bacterium]MDK2933080.1 two-component system, sensor histidine kinase PdtaS [Clostridiales bacterium]
MLKDLCMAYTDLSPSDIQKLQKIEEFLPIIADVVRADVFIDCSTEDKNKAIVVAEAKPNTCESMYEYSVVGKFAFRENEPAALRTLEIGMPTRDLKAITQENKTVRQNTVPIKNEIGKVIGVLITEQDITKHLKRDWQMEFLSQTTEQLTETILSFKGNENIITHHINEAIIIFNRKGVATYANPGAVELFEKLGYKDGIVGMHFDNLVLDGTAFEKIIKDLSSEVVEVAIGNLSLRVRYAAMRQKNIVVGVSMLIKDITEEREKEKELILKSVAIKEIHHRVKNNLQTIASLLRLQSRRIDTELAKKAFNESISRILSIAVTHELLAQKGVDDVDIKTILSKIKDNTIHYGLPPDKDIRVSIKGDSFIVNSDKATSIALVINELLQNCLKHAFKGKDRGLIDVCIQKGSLYSSISVIDDGNGFDVEAVENDSLGWNIVKRIVEDKLSGHLNIESDQNGTKIMFDFKNE